MTIVSLADACRHLGVDVKTVRRWLAEAQLPLHTHPGDGRKKGVSQEQLELLAHLHHRRLTLLPPEPPAPEKSEPPELSATLLALPETLGALQAQIVALRAAVADLTHLIQQLHPEAPAQPPTRARRVPKPASPAPRARSAPKPPRKPAHVIPRVEYTSRGNYVVICPKKGRLPFEPDAQEWFAWVAKQDSFRFVGKAGHFTAHHEWRVPRGAWRAHRKIRNHNRILRLAPNQELTIAVLERAAAALQALLA